MATIVGTRSPLFYKAVKGGLPVILDTSKFTGNVFFVDSAAAGKGDTTGHGTTPDSPFATIDYAVGRCTANQGDVILVLPGHAESINAAGAIALDVAGISVIGLGNGEDRPTITVGTTLDTATVTVGAADVKVENLVFQPGNDGVDILLDINADGCIVENCEFRSDEANAYQADTYLDINGGAANAADRTVVRGCKFSSITAGAAQAIEIGDVEDALVIEDCWIDGDWSAAGIHSAAIFTNALIRRNIVSNRNAGDHAIELSAAATGMLVDNRLYGDTLGTILDPGSMKCLGNLETDAVDQAGVDSPRTSAGGFPDNSITAAAIATDAIDADALADGAITAAVFAAGAIDAAAIAAGAIDAATFAAGAIDAAAIAAGAIDAATFAAGAIDAAAIAAGAIDAATFAAGAIDAAAIATNAIDADALADGAITAATFAAGAIDAAAIANGAIDAATFAAGAIDAAAIANAAIDAATLATDVGAWRFARSDWDFAVDTGAAAAYTVFTVTGDVLLQIVGVCEASITAAGPVTAELGVSGNTAALIAQIVDARDLLINEIWQDATPTATVEAFNAEGSHTFVVANGQDVQFLIGAGGLTAGKINFYAFWKPLSANGNVVAA